MQNTNERTAKIPLSALEILRALVNRWDFYPADSAKDSRLILAARTALNSAVPESVNIAETGKPECNLALVRVDHAPRDRDGAWSWHAVLSVDGPLPMDPEDESDGGTVDESAVFRGLESLGVHIIPDGSNGAGRPFAERPWVQYLGEPTRTLWVSQRGGLDI